LNKALFKALDHRNLPQLQQPGLSGDVELMDKRQVFKPHQRVHTLKVGRRGRLCVQKIFGIPGEAADQQRDVIHHFRHRSQA
jgi:hypothetical protein